MTDLAERVERLRSRLRAACDRASRPLSEVELLPVSKRQPVERVREALALGFPRFGENYVQEGAAKAGLRPDTPCVACETVWNAWLETALPGSRWSTDVAAARGRGASTCKIVLTKA